jgi:hypothetical protein
LLAQVAMDQKNPLPDKHRIFKSPLKGGGFALNLVMSLHPHPDDVSSGCEPLVPTLSKGLEVVQTEIMRPRVCESLVAERPYWNLDKPDGLRHCGYRIDPPDKMILYRPLVPTLSKGPEVAPTQMMRPKGCERLVPTLSKGRQVEQTQRAIDAQGSSRPSLLVSFDTEEAFMAEFASGMWAGRS